MEQMFNDSARFEKIIKLLPEQKIIILADELSNGYYSKGFLEMLINYKDYSETIMSEFKDRKIEKNRKAFNESIQSLLRFLSTHFFSQSEKYYALYPELKETPKWDKWFEELHIETEVFQRKYNELFAVGKKVLDELSSTPEKISEAKNKFPHKLPAGVEWKNFIIQFLNKEEVFIKVNRFKENEKYIDMGFADNRFSEPQPNEGWSFLWVLAQYNGELTIKDPDAKDTYKKQKGLISKALKFHFSMESDPFYPYQETKSYKTRFTLLPPPEETTGKKVKKRPLPVSAVEEDDVDEDIKQFFDEQATQVYDKRG